MLDYPHFDPVAVALGPVKIHWYGLMYLVGFAAAWLLGRQRAARSGSAWTAEMVDDLVFYGALGAVVGGRLGYMLFYGQARLVENPLSLLMVWEGGMSFHGGLLGTMLAIGYFARQHRRGFFQVADFAAPLVPPGLLAGRIGNFINGELWGRPTDWPWGMRVPCARVPEVCQSLPLDSFWSVPLHPSQLYEAALEGIVLFVALWWFTQRPRPLMAASGLFLLLYGIFRILVEFVRQPDAHIGYLAADWLTMGQLLSFPMVLSGRVRIARRLADGRELVLYDVGPGESCVLSTGCLLGNASYSAHGDCETDVELALLPRELFDRLVAEHPPFRIAVFNLFGERLVRLVELAEAVGFQRVEQRLAAALLGAGPELRTSHEKLAQRLGASRETVSRALNGYPEVAEATRRRPGNAGRWP